MRQKQYWVIADRHLGHEKLVRDGYRKPDFEYQILSNITQAMFPGDVLIDLGDVTFYNHKFWHEQMFNLRIPETKHWLIRGNHDPQSNGWYLDHGWDFVGEQLILDMFGKKILFSHEPQCKTNCFDINIHGHLHDGTHRLDQTFDYHCLVQIEQTLAPVNLKSLVDQHYLRSKG